MTKINQRKSFWPYGIICFFLVVFTFNFWFVYKANQSNLGQLEDDTYNKSLRYQEVIDLKASSKKLGWQVSYQYSAGSLQIALQDHLGKQLADLNLQLEIIPLSYKGESINSQPQRSGPVYVQSIDLPQGLYQLRLDVTDSNQKFYNEYQLLVS